MRIRTLAALVSGAAMGAGGVYLFDPDAGPDRRKQALRSAWDRSKQVDWSAVAVKTTSAATELGRRAADGYREGATTDD